MTDNPQTTGPCDYPTCSVRGAGHPLACKCSAQPVTTPDPQAKITMEEMAAMFGSHIPVEAAQLLFNSPDGMTIGEVRAKLREIANIPGDTPQTTALLSALKKVDEVAWTLSHHLPVSLISFSLDEALHLSALIEREIANAK